MQKLFVSYVPYNTNTTLFGSFKHTFLNFMLEWNLWITGKNCFRVTKLSPPW